MLIIKYAPIAQSVEQRTENPRVGGSIPPLGTNKSPKHFQIFLNQTTGITDSQYLCGL